MAFIAKTQPKWGRAGGLTVKLTGLFFKKYIAQFNSLQNDDLNAMIIT
jgi:hypothetical protein